MIGMTHSDTHVRVVSLVNLKAMCERVSGMCHRYFVDKVTANRVYVAYTGPRFDEVGYQDPDHTLVAVFPCFPGGKYNPNVVLEYLNVLHDDMDGEGWQAFECLRDCPVLWSKDHLDPDTEWRSRKEIEIERGEGPQPYTGYRYVEKLPDGSVRDCFPEMEG